MVELSHNPTIPELAVPEVYEPATVRFFIVVFLTYPNKAGVRSDEE